MKDKDDNSLTASNQKITESTPAEMGLPQGGMNRRQFLNSIVAIGVVGSQLSSMEANADDDDLPVEPVIIPPSPATTAWVDYLPDAIVPLLGTTLSPSPTLKANIAAGEAGRLPHQKWNEVINKYGYEGYELFAVQLNNWVFNQAYPPQAHWGYQGTPTHNVMPALPSEVLVAHYGHPLICRIHNKLPSDHKGFGVPEISTHLHNLHCASESDGYPGDYYSETLNGPTLTSPGYFKDHLYINLFAGFATSADGYGKSSEALGTLFYHDHTENFTGANVYRGLSGFYLLFDDVDSGNEKDLSAKALKLPSGDYDYPLHICDKRFDQDGILYYDQLNSDGVLGDKIVINGRIEPLWQVARRKYRLRLLNAGPTRFYSLAIVNKSNKRQTFSYIANDGNLLPNTLFNQTAVYLGVAERADIVFDFSRYPIGTELYLVNRLEQSSTRKPDKIVDPGVKIMKIIINRDPPVVDVSRVPSTLRPLPIITAAEKLAAPVRQWVFARKGGLWTVNDKIFDMNRPEAKVTKNSAEIWEFINPSGGWSHPIHLHLEEGVILQITVNGVEVKIPNHQKGRKDVFVLEPYMTMRVFIRFRDFTGKYVLHCHNLIHEDHAMMVRWDVI